MFNWKVENMELMKMGFVDNEYTFEDAHYAAEEYVFKCESQVSAEDKIAFIDSLHDGLMSYIVSVSAKFDAEKDTLKTDKFGDYRTVSLNAWVKRNDPRGVFLHTNFWWRNTLGYFRFLGVEGHVSGISIDTFFHAQLKECFMQEIQYYLEHNADYQEVKGVCENLEKYGHNPKCRYGTADRGVAGVVTNFNFHINHWSIDLDMDGTERRELSINEVRLLEEALAPVEEKYQNLLKAQAEMQEALTDAGADFVKKLGL